MEYGAFIHVVLILTAQGRGCFLFLPCALFVSLSQGVSGLGMVMSVMFTTFGLGALLLLLSTAVYQQAFIVRNGAC